MTSYSVGTTSCNVGTVPLDWFASSNQHPVMTNNMLRLMNGRLEQIGVGWCKHGFCALQGNACMTCQPYGGGCEQRLGVGCSDPYSANLNGGQSGLGPRSDINATTGFFSWPFSTRGQTGNTLYKRIQVANDDLNPSLNPGALYFAEGQYIALDDATAGNGLNNASYRPFVVGSMSGGGYRVSWSGSTVRESPAIFAWYDHGLGFNVQDPDVTLIPVDVEGDGRFWVGYKVTDNGDGTWHYEYAIENLNSTRNAGSFSIPTGDGVVITNAGFHDINYHSGEAYDPTDWSVVIASDSVTWSSPETYAVNPDSNAIRWATLYNFWFDANSEPTEALVDIGLFAPGSPAEAVFVASAPNAAGCAADFNGDGVVNTLDFLAYLNAYSAGDDSADFNGDGVVDILDLLSLLGTWGPLVNEYLLGVLART
ncbi:MAG: hypothetical protein IH889_09995 [Planctomycetes bacterium]|nr:hypothetical protein [Planctomycetota bacterium]